ncbi:MAG: glycosyltransferase family A protein [Vicinamibacterales bacterium]
MQVSILIPTRNRCEALRKTLESLAAIAPDAGNHEVIVVDNGSTDDTRAVAEHAAHALPALRYVFEPMPGLLSGRHRAAKEAKGDVCAYLDDDVQVGPEWLTGMTDAFRDPGVAMVGGPSTPLFRSEPPDWLAEFYAEDEQGRYCGWLSLFDGGDRIKDIDPCLVWGLNYAIRRPVLFDVGGFHPDNIPKALQRYQGDGETGLSLSVKRAGLKAQYHPKVAVQHVTPASRLTAEYFAERGFYQGVCNSYTQLREDGGRAAAPPSPSWLGRLRQFARDNIHGEQSPAAAMRRRTAAAYAAGHAFHQQEVRRDPTLLEWVLRPDYWDYQLPSGWEQYLGAIGTPR